MLAVSILSRPCLLRWPHFTTPLLAKCCMRIPSLSHAACLVLAPWAISSSSGIIMPVSGPCITTSRRSIPPGYGAAIVTWWTSKSHTPRPAERHRAPVKKKIVLSLPPFPLLVPFLSSLLCGGFLFSSLKAWHSVSEVIAVAMRQTAAVSILRSPMQISADA